MKEQARWLSEIWGKVAEGEELVYMDNRPFSSGPGLDSDPDDWSTRKPKPKIVDLSPLVNSGVLCEFWNKSPEGLRKRAFLKSVEGTPFSEVPFIDDHKSVWTHCRPLLNHWNAISSLCVVLKRLDGTVFETQATKVSGKRMIKYTGLQDGYEWP